MVWLDSKLIKWLTPSLEQNGEKKKCCTLLSSFMKIVVHHSCFSSENSALESSFMSNKLLKLRLPGRLESCEKIKIKN